MASSRPSREMIERAMPIADAWRQAPTGTLGERTAYKEWMHFCVCLPGDGHLLVNFNVTESASAEGVERVPRLIALGCDGVWSGALETFAEHDVRGRAGDLDLRFGRNQIEWKGGAFHLEIEAGTLAARLRLDPLVLPTVASRVSFGKEHSIQWVVVPRLEATGWVQLGDRRVRLEGASAYHDHNWGHFRWGGDLAWEWGFVNPADARSPFSAVFVRVSDRGGHKTFSQALLLWKGDTLIRAFQDREVRFTLEGAHAGPRPFTLPKIAALLAPGTTTGVPARVVVEARGQGEHVTVEFETSSKARVAIPSDVDPFRLVFLNETCGTARVTGSTAAGSVDFAGPSIMEFVRG
jgi:hypothetical protein